MTRTQDGEKVTVFCYGGCGRSVQLRKASIRDSDVVCCLDCFYGRSPRLYPGKVRTFSEHKHDGETFRKIRDIWPDAEMIKEIQEAQEIWARTLAEVAIEEALEKAGGKRTEQDDLTIGEELALWAEREKRIEEFEKSIPPPRQLPP